MRTLAVVAVAVTVWALLSGCTSDGNDENLPASPAPTSSPTATPSPAPPAGDEPGKPGADVTELSCSSIIPAHLFGSLSASGHEPHEITDFDPRVLELIFVQNGGIYCEWHHPDYQDSFPGYGYSVISDEQALSVRSRLLEWEYVQGEVNGLASFEGPLGTMSGVYLFGDGAWYLGWTLEEALEVAHTVSGSSSK